jgi:hypothetical protein
MLDHLKSTRSYRYGQRATGIQEIVIGILQSISLETMLPIKVAQTVTNAFVLFSRKVKVQERIVAALEAVLALASTVLVGILIFSREPCTCLETTTNKLCLSVGILELVFQGVLLITWVPGEFLKEECPDSQRPLDGLRHSV